MATKKATTVSPEEEKKPEKVVKAFEDMTPEEQYAYGEEPVEIELFYDGEKYSDDVYVSVGKHTCIIKRGVKVTVPRCVAWVLRDSEMAKKEAALNERELQEAYNSVSKRLGLK